MLGNAADTLLLHSAYIMDTKLTDYIRILAKAFISAAPARIPGNVDYRTHRRADAHAAALLSDNRAHFLRQRRLPCTSHINHCRKQCPARRRITAKIFCLQRYRDTKTCLLYKIFLHLIGNFRNLNRIYQSYQRILGESSVPIRKFFTQRIDIYLTVHDKCRCEISAELRRFLFQRHSGKKIFYARLCCLIFVLINFHPLSSCIIYLI